MNIDPTPLFNELRTAKGARKAALENQIATEALADPYIRSLISGLPGPRDPDDRESIAGEALVKAIRAYDPKKAAFGTFFELVLADAFSDAFRKEQRRVLVESGAEVPESYETPNPSWDDVTQGASSADRRLLTLRFVEGLTYEEIAEKISLPETSVRERLKEALARSRRRIFAEN